jgi:putative oxidoreductase
MRHFQVKTSKFFVNTKSRSPGVSSLSKNFKVQFELELNKEFSLMKAKLPMIARLLLGFVFFASGLAGLLNLAPPPPDLPERLQTFNAGMMASIYFFPFLKLTETFCGLLLLSGYFVPLALVVLAPVVLNIFLVHAFMAPSGLPLAIVLGALLVYLAFFAKPYSLTIKQLFRAK